MRSASSRLERRGLRPVGPHSPSLDFERPARPSSAMSLQQRARRAAVHRAARPPRRASSATGRQVDPSRSASPSTCSTRRARARGRSTRRRAARAIVSAIVEPDAEHARQLVRPLAHDRARSVAVLLVEPRHEPGQPVRRQQQVQRAGRAQRVPRLRPPRSRAAGSAPTRGTPPRGSRSIASEHVVAVPRRSAAPRAPAPTCLTRRRYAASAVARRRERLGRRDRDLQPVAPVLLPHAARPRRARAARGGRSSRPARSRPRPRSASSTPKPVSSLANRAAADDDLALECGAGDHGQPTDAASVSGGHQALPDEVAPQRLTRRALQVFALVVVLILIAVLTPGLGDVRALLERAAPGWMAIAVVFEVLELRFVRADVPPDLLPRDVAGARRSRSRCSELAVGPIVPASGAAGWRSAPGSDARRDVGGEVARRSVAFLLIKSSVNFVAVAVLGAVMVVDVRPAAVAHRAPAALAAAAIALVAAVPRLGPGADPREDAGKVRKAARRDTQGARRRHGGGGRDRQGARRAGPHRRDRLLGVGQRRPVGDVPRGRARRCRSRRS